MSMVKRILIYLEPCIFRDDPLFLSGHYQCFVDPILRAMSKDSSLSFTGFAGNIFLALEGLKSARALKRTPHEVKVYALYNNEILADRDYCIESYARDIFDSSDSPIDNGALVRRITEILADAKPDFIISTSQNKYLKRLASEIGVPVLSVEFGPLPRLAYPLSRFLSVQGHLSDGPLSTPLRLKTALDEIEESNGDIDDFEANYFRAISLHSQFSVVRDYMAEMSSGGTVSMLSLQAEQWVTWEGALGKRRSLASIIHEALANLKTDKLIVTFHADLKARLNPSSLREIWLSDKRLEWLPTDISVGFSELFLPFVDELITVSSNLAMAGYLLGKPLKAIGTSFAGTLESLSAECDKNQSVVARGRLFKYVTDHMSIDDNEFHDVDRLSDRISKLVAGHRCELRQSIATHQINNESERTIDLAENKSIDSTSVDLKSIQDAIRTCLDGTPHELLPLRFGRHFLSYCLPNGAVGAEFGVAKGFFSESLLRSGKFDLLYSVDKWSDHHDDAEAELVRGRLFEFGEQSQILKMSFSDALKVIPDRSLDFVYVDGYAHTGQDPDIISFCLGKVKVGGVVAAHDYDRFSWPINHRKLTELFSSRRFSDVTIYPGVLTGNDEDIFASIAARYLG